MEMVCLGSISFTKDLLKFLSIFKGINANGLGMSSSSHELVCFRDEYTFFFFHTGIHISFRRINRAIAYTRC